MSETNMKVDIDVPTDMRKKVIRMAISDLHSTSDITEPLFRHVAVRLVGHYAAESLELIEDLEMEIEREVEKRARGDLEITKQLRDENELLRRWLAMTHIGASRMTLEKLKEMFSDQPMVFHSLDTDMSHG